MTAKQMMKTKTTQIFEPVKSIWGVHSIPIARDRKLYQGGVGVLYRPIWYPNAKALEDKNGNPASLSCHLTYTKKRQHQKK